jgi:hypothetical protein
MEHIVMTNEETASTLVADQTDEDPAHAPMMASRTRSSEAKPKKTPVAETPVVVVDPIVGRSWPAGPRPQYAGLRRLTDSDIAALICGRIGFAIGRRQRLSGKPMVVCDIVDEEQGCVYLDVVCYDDSDMQLLITGTSERLRLKIRPPQQQGHRAVGWIVRNIASKP